LARQLQDSFEQVARAVQALFSLALAAGLAVLYAALQASADERQRELAVMRALGARGRQLRAALLAEFAVLGALAGSLAGLGAGAIGWALARFVFHLPYVPGPWLPLVGLLAGTLGVAAAGLWATRAALRRPVTADFLSG
ncbi:MAG TPA: FtsX-like permease family protein, partial [Rhodocyclaceae bacterium]|nr:FtsX-like permease family protein [Rhodocyclaceae bacterium]